MSKRRGTQPQTIRSLRRRAASDMEFVTNQKHRPGRGGRTRFPVGVRIVLLLQVYSSGLRQRRFPDNNNCVLRQVVRGDIANRVDFKNPVMVERAFVEILFFRYRVVFPVNGENQLAVT